MKTEDLEIPICGSCGYPPVWLDDGKKALICGHQGCENFNMKHTIHMWIGRYQVLRSPDPALITALAKAIEVLSAAKLDTTQAALSLRYAIGGEMTEKGANP